MDILVPMKFRIPMCLLLATVAVAAAFAQSGGPVRTTDPAVRMIRSVSGTRGSEQAGRFVIEDPKNVFHLPDDKKVIVYFEWEGRPGSHHFEGQWKNPEGKTVVMSDFKFDTKDRRFAAYWELLLSEGMATGMWALEALLDGQPAGTHTFRIIQAPGTAPVTDARRVRTPAELYQQLSAATVTLEKLDATGQVAATAAGFMLAPGKFATAFQAIDGAARLRIVTPTGARLEVSQVLAWSRWGDWAVLAIPDAQMPVLPIAAAKNWSVGDRAHTLEVGADGHRVLADAAIVGIQTHGQAGERIHITFSPPERSIGAPLLNEYGEVIGVAGGALLPGTGTLGRVSYAPIGFGIQTGRAVPITDLKTDASAPATLHELSTRGEFLTLLRKGVAFQGSLGTAVNTSAPGYTRVVDAKTEFQRSAGEIYLVIVWEQDPKAKKGQTTFRVYDVNNRLLSESKPGKVDLKPGRTGSTHWKFSIANWPVGTYRADVTYDGEPVWRGFFKVGD